MLTLSSDPSHAEPIYDTMIASPGGALTVTQGIVTRISDVRPMLTVATYVEGF